MKSLLVLLSFIAFSQAAVQLTIPTNPKAPAAPVLSNFLGTSIELSYADDYFGKDVNSIPQTFVNYMTALRNRTQKHPLRVRVGGNSMDISTFLPDMTSLVLNRTHLERANFQASDFGPVLFNLFNGLADKVKAGGFENDISYLFGLSLRDPADPGVPVLAAATVQSLGPRLDAFLLGNEPDLYEMHDHRNNFPNYTTSLYISEFKQASDRLKATAAGDMVEKNLLAGPTICCVWDFKQLIDDGYTSNFTETTKYTTLQHYIQNNCQETHPYELPYYLQHSNGVVGLADWQKDGLTASLANGGPPLVMTEFNSAACGGLPGISDTFAVGGLWTMSYSLQLAAAGYEAAYIHTRERGVTYNVFSTPVSNDTSSTWVTHPPFYAMLAVTEALQSENGAIVVDLDAASSRTDPNAGVAAYSVHDAKDSTVLSVVILNTGASAQTFAIPASAFNANSRSVTVKFLHADGSKLDEYEKVSWGGQTLAGVTDGVLVGGAQWAKPNEQKDCAAGCDIDLPPYTAAVVFTRTGQQTLTTGANNNDAAALHFGYVNWIIGFALPYLAFVSL